MIVWCGEVINFGKKWNHIHNTIKTNLQNITKVNKNSMTYPQKWYPYPWLYIFEEIDVSSGPININWFTTFSNTWSSIWNKKFIKNDFQFNHNDFFSKIKDLCIGGEGSISLINGQSILLSSVQGLENNNFNSTTYIPFEQKSRILGKYPNRFTYRFSFIKSNVTLL